MNISKPTARRRLVAGICAAVLAPIAITFATAAPAQAALQAEYEEVCDGYREIRGLRIPDEGPLYGYVFIGRRDDVGRVCAATIKNDSVRRFTEASVFIRSSGVWHYDKGDYRYYAGEPCTYNPPSKCSAIHARDQIVDFSGQIGGYRESGIYNW